MAIKPNLKIRVAMFLIFEKIMDEFLRCRLPFSKKATVGKTKPGCCVVETRARELGMDRNEFKPPKSPKLTENEMFRKNRKNIVNDSDRSEAMETIRIEMQGLRP